MMKISIICLAGILFFASCENTGSSTVGTYEQDDTSAPSDKKEDNAKEETSDNKNAGNTYIDTSKTDEGFAERKDTNSSVDKKTMKADSATKKASSKP